MRHSALKIWKKVQQANDNADNIEFYFEVDQKFEHSPIGKKKHVLIKLD